MTRRPDPPRLRLVGSDKETGPRDDAPKRSRAAGLASRVSAGGPTPPRPKPRPIDPARTLRPGGGSLRAVDDDRARFAVERENRQAATRLDLDPTDPRWVLAVRTASQMEGGVLTPERRERVMRTASHLGMRPFDAGIVIALVQDRLRRGGSVGDVTAQLEMLANPVRQPRRGRLPAWARFAIALLVATAANVLVIRWLIGI